MSFIVEYIVLLFCFIKECFVLYYPKISVLMVSYNRGNVIEQAISSVVNQTYKNIELVVIDGGSEDGTLDVLNKYNSSIKYWCSEKDNGIYHAANKALEQISGDYFIWLSTDDSFVSEDVIECAVKKLDESIDVLSGWIYWVNNNGYEYLGKNTHAVDKEKYSGGMIPTEGVFWRTDLVKKYKFDESYKVAADYKLFLQLYYSDNVKFKYIDLPITYFAVGGISSVQSVCIEEDNRIYRELNLLQFVDRHLRCSITQKIGISIRNAFHNMFFFGILQNVRDKIFRKKHHCNNKICRWCGRK